MKNKGAIISLAIILTVGILITKGTHHFVRGNRTDSVMTAQTMENKANDRIIQEDKDEISEEKSGETQEESFVSEKTQDTADTGVSIKTTGSNAPVAAGKSFSSDSSSGENGFAQKEEERKDIVTENTVSGVITPLDTVPQTEAIEEDQERIEKDSVLVESQSYYKKRLQDLDSQIQKTRESQSDSNLNSSARAASNELKLWDSELNSIYNIILERLDQESSQQLVNQQRIWMKERDSQAMEAAKASSGDSSESVEYTVSLTQSTRARAYELVEIYAEELED